MATRSINSTYPPQIKQHACSSCDYWRNEAKNSQALIRFLSAQNAELERENQSLKWRLRIAELSPPISSMEVTSCGILGSDRPPDLKKE